MERGYYEYYSKEELTDKDNNLKHVFDNISPITSEEEKLSRKDDKLDSNIWTQAYKTAAYYYDNPTNEDRYRMLTEFRFNYKGLLDKTNNGNELPDLRNRKFFVAWVCKKHNEYLEKQGENMRVECSTKLLLEKFGPNEKNVRQFLGASEFFL